MPRSAQPVRVGVAAVASGDAGMPGGIRRGRLAVGGLAAAACLAEMLLLPWLAPLDRAVAGVTPLAQGQAFDVTVLALSHAAPWVAAMAALVAAGAAWRRGARATVRRTALVTIIGLVLTALLKAVIERARPDLTSWSYGSGSFPSGHVANAMLLMLAFVRLATIATPRPSRRLVRMLAGVAAAWFVGAVAAARVYLARHWATDVAGALSLSAAVFMIGDVVGTPVATRRSALAAAVLALGLLAAAASAGWCIPLESAASEMPHPPALHLGQRGAPTRS